MQKYFLDKLNIIYYQLVLVSSLFSSVFIFFDLALFKFGESSFSELLLTRFIGVVLLNLILIFGVRFVYLNDKSISIEEIPINIFWFYLVLQVPNFIIGYGDPFGTYFSFLGLFFFLDFVFSFAVSAYLVLKWNLAVLKKYHQTLHNQK